MSLKKEVMSKWLTDIRTGNLNCPFDGCSWTFFTSFELADHVKEDCNFGKYIDKVPCTHCAVQLHADDLKVHWRNTHKDMVGVLKYLHKGTETECPNYLCDYVFPGTFSGCKMYTQHSISCRPLFLCQDCKNEYTTRNIFKQHKCSGTPKKYHGEKIFSRVEVEVDRNITTRPKLSDNEENLAVLKWRESFKSGHFTCPVPSCSKSFFVLTNFISHLKKEAKFDKIFTRICNVECPYCSAEVAWEVFERHVQNNHRAISNYVKKLKTGDEIKCPNYKCSQTFSCETGIDYLKHSINCRPLFCCPYCHGEFGHESYVDKHKLKCKNNTSKQFKQEANDSKKNLLANKLKRKSVGYGASKVKAEARNSINQVSSDEFISPSKSLEIKRSKLSSYSVPKVKKVGYRTSSAKNKVRVRHMSISSDSSAGSSSIESLQKLKNELDDSSTANKKISLLSVTSRSRRKTFSRKSNQNLDKKKLLLKVGYGIRKRLTHGATNRKRHINDTSNDSNVDCLTTAASGSDGGTESDQIFMPIAVQSDQLSSSFCGRKTNKTKILETVVKEKVQKEMAADLSKSSTWEGKESLSSLAQNVSNKISVNVHTTGRNSNVKRLADTWLSNIKIGVWNCAFPKCKETFYLPTDFYNHITSYPANENLKQQIQQTKLTCCFCQDALTVPAFARHFKQKHAEILYEGVPFICQIEKCKSSFSTGEEYLKHSCNCPVALKEKEDEKEDERKKGLMTKWQADLKKGIMRCANESCNDVFTLPNQMVDHIKTCMMNDTNTYIMANPIIVCPWDEEKIDIKHFTDHFVKKHGHIRNIIVNNRGSFTCANFNCGMSFKTTIEFLHHTILCATCLVCTDCNQNFLNFELYEQHDCLRYLDMWSNQARSGQLSCPKSSCGARFFILEEFFDHVNICAQTTIYCQALLQKDIIPCTFCNVSQSFEAYLHHIKSAHPEILQNLLHLKEGRSVFCLNYKCKKEFSNGLLYFHHASICKPLYSCSLCTKEFTKATLYESHKCTGTDPKDKNETTEDRQTACEDPSCSNTISKWYSNLKAGIFICPSSKCNTTFKTFETLLPHLHSCDKDNTCEVALKQGLFGCCICKEDVPIDDFMYHFKQLHSTVFNCLLKLTRSHSIRCHFNGCKKVFLDSGKYLEHVITNHRCANCFGVCSSYHECKNNMNTKKKILSWHEEISKGNLVCPNRGCKKKHTLIENLIEHLHVCRVSREASKALAATIPCLICKVAFPARELSDHFKSKHTVVFAQLRLVEQGICIHCPNSNCRKAFAYGTQYLQHIATKCQPVNACNKCKLSFDSQNLLDSHDCGNNQTTDRPQDKLWNVFCLTPWYERVQRGDLKCPNSSCSCEFILPRDFISHLRRCTEGDECAEILKRNELPCCFCKKYVSLGKYRSHLSACHASGLQSAKYSSSTSPTPSTKTSKAKTSPIKQKRIRKTKPRKVSLKSESYAKERSIARGNNSAIEEVDFNTETNSQTDDTSSRESSMKLQSEAKANNENVMYETDLSTPQKNNDADTSHERSSLGIAGIVSQPNEINVLTVDVEPSSIGNDTVTLYNHCEEDSSSVAGTEKGTAEISSSDLNISNDSNDTEVHKTDDNALASPPAIGINTNSNILKKFKEKAKSKPKQIKKFINDKEVINLAAELLKKRKRKSRLALRTSMCAKIGEWKITSTPKRIKQELLEKDATNENENLDDADTSEENLSVGDKTEKTYALPDDVESSTLRHGAQNGMEQIVDSISPGDTLEKLRTKGEIDRLEKQDSTNNTAEYLSSYKPVETTITDSLNFLSDDNKDEHVQANDSVETGKRKYEVRDRSTSLTEFDSLTKTNTEVDKNNASVQSIIDTPEKATKSPREKAVTLRPTKRRTRSLADQTIKFCSDTDLFDLGERSGKIIPFTRRFTRSRNVRLLDASVELKMTPPLKKLKGNSYIKTEAESYMSERAVEFTHAFDKNQSNLIGNTDVKVEVSDIKEEINLEQSEKDLLNTKRKASKVADIYNNEHSTKKDGLATRRRSMRVQEHAKKHIDHIDVKIKEENHCKGCTENSEFDTLVNVEVHIDDVMKPKTKRRKNSAAKAVNITRNRSELSKQPCGPISDACQEPVSAGNIDAGKIVKDLSGGKDDDFPMKKLNKTLAQVSYEKPETYKQYLIKRNNVITNISSKPIVVEGFNNPNTIYISESTPVDIVLEDKAKMINEEEKDNELSVTLKVQEKQSKILKVNNSDDNTKSTVEGKETFLAIPHLKSEVPSSELSSIHQKTPIELPIYKSDQNALINENCLATTESLYLVNNSELKRVSINKCENTNAETDHVTSTGITALNANEEEDSSTVSLETISEKNNLETIEKINPEKLIVKCDSGKKIENVDSISFEKMLTKTPDGITAGEVKEKNIINNVEVIGAKMSSKSLVPAKSTDQKKVLQQTPVISKQPVRCSEEKSKIKEESKFNVKKDFDCKDAALLSVKCLHGDTFVGENTSTSFSQSTQSPNITTVSYDVKQKDLLKAGDRKEPVKSKSKLALGRRFKYSTLPITSLFKRKEMTSNQNVKKTNEHLDQERDAANILTLLSLPSPVAKQTNEVKFESNNELSLEDTKHVIDQSIGSLISPTLHSETLGSVNRPIEIPSFPSFPPVNMPLFDDEEADNTEFIDFHIESPCVTRKPVLPVLKETSLAIMSYDSSTESPDVDVCHRQEELKTDLQLEKISETLQLQSPVIPEQVNEKKPDLKEMYFLLPKSDDSCSQVGESHDENSPLSPSLPDISRINFKSKDINLNADYENKNEHGSVNNVNVMPDRCLDIAETTGFYNGSNENIDHTKESSVVTGVNNSFDVAVQSIASLAIELDIKFESKLTEKENARKSSHVHDANEVCLKERLFVPTKSEERIVNPQLNNEKCSNLVEPWDVSSWADSITSYNFTCPSEECDGVTFLRINAMMNHIKICLKKEKIRRAFLTAPVSCPECKQSYNAEKLHKHFNEKHLLLNWYFGQVEIGNWAICQNYKCAKYMDDTNEIIEHFRKCEYLWKCKYCSIEYNNEVEVSKHHCQTSSDGDENLRDQKETIKKVNVKDRIEISSNKTLSASSTGKKVDLTHWISEVQKFNFICPIDTCNNEFIRPLQFGKHLRECKQLIKMKEDSEVLRNIDSIKIKCPVTGCKGNETPLLLQKVWSHFNHNHNQIIASGITLKQNGRVKCANCTCNAELTTKEDVLKHWLVCKFLWKCNQCEKKYRSKAGKEAHACINLDANKSKGEMEETGDNGKKEEKEENEESLIDNDGKRRKRKSAAKAINILTELIHNEVKKEQESHGSESNENVVGDILEESMSETDEDYNAPSDADIQGSSDEWNEEEENDDNEEEVTSSEEEINDMYSDVEKISKKMQRDFYDSDFLTNWLNEHKSTDLLFPSLVLTKDQIAVRSESEYTDFIPLSKKTPLITVQYYTKNKRVSTKPIALKLFEAMPSLEECSTLTFNAGGPIWSLEWCPTPSDTDQYLAVSTHKTMAETHCIVDTTSEKGLIQIWRVGKLNSKECTQPSLCLGICHNFGPVYDLKWCPSGCYGLKESDSGSCLKRLGLLAVACGDGNIRIFSVPEPCAVSLKLPAFVDIQPSLVLIPHKADSFERTRTGMCLCVEWQPNGNHQLLAAGYGGGGVRIWNLNTSSVFLTVEHFGKAALLPPIYIHAHSYAVKSIAWCPYNPNILATASSDKVLNVFDINEPHNPVFTLKRGLLLDVKWPITRLALFFTEDDCLNVLPSSARACVLENMFREHRTEKDVPHPTTRHASAAMCCSYNNFLDLIATCDVAGEVIVAKDIDTIGTKSHENHRKTEPVYHIERAWADENENRFKIDMNKNDVTRVPDKDSDCVDLLEEYTKSNKKTEQVFQKYSYQFCDSNKFEYSKYRKKTDPDVHRCLKIERLQRSNVEEYETRSVHKVTWNPNYGCHTWLATGTRLGVVRIHNFKAWR